jgi:TonB family protein
MGEGLRIRRRPEGHRPMQRRTLGRAGAVPRLAFPGFLSPPGSHGSRWWSGGLAALVHGLLAGALILLSVTHPIVKPEIVPVKLLREEPPKPEPKRPGPRGPETPAPVPKEAPPREAAPAPKVLAERRSPSFAPAAQAVAPQIVNPSVVAKAAPTVEARKLEMSAVGQVVAPKEIGRAAVVAERVSPLSSVAAAEASKIDLRSAAAPALRGPIESQAPAGPSVGPRQVATTGTTTGTGTVTGPAAGSSVREGIASNRDVLGSPQGAPLASVNTRVGEGFLRGDGGNGDGGGGGGGGGDGDCFDRPEVLRYTEQIKERMYARWVLPAGATPDASVQLQFKLDRAGAVRSVQVIAASDAALGSSAVEALRSAAPFPPMSDRVLCMARMGYFVGTFRNPVSGR